jgi:hypothetical protein
MLYICMWNLVLWLAWRIYFQLMNESFLLWLFFGVTIPLKLDIFNAANIHSFSKSRKCFVTTASSSGGVFCAVSYVHYRCAPPWEMIPCQTVRNREFYLVAGLIFNIRPLHYYSQHQIVLMCDRKNKLYNNFPPECCMHLLYPPSFTYEIPRIEYHSLSIVRGSYLVFYNILNFLRERKSPGFKLVCLELYFHVCFCLNGQGIHVAMNIGAVEIITKYWKHLDVLSLVRLSQIVNICYIHVP